MVGPTALWRRLQPRWWELTPLAIAVAMAIRSSRADTHKVFPDTISFIELAKIWPRGSALGGFREPVWTTLLAVPSVVFDAETVARVMSVIGFLLLVAVTQLAARRFWGRGWGVVAGTLIGASPFLAFWAVQGLREETAAAAIVGFGLLVLRGPLARRDWLILAAYAGLLAMLRWDTLILTLPVLLIAALIARVDRRTALLAVGLLMLILSPFVIGSAVRLGDPLYSTNRNATYYRNLEFHGQPGFPSDATVRKNAFVGPDTTWGEYIFGDHELDEVTRRAIEGPVASALTITSRAFFFDDAEAPPVALPTLADTRSLAIVIPWLVTLLGALGAVVMVRRGRWPFAALLVLAAAQHFPIVQLRSYDFRLETIVYPLLVLAALEAVHWIVGKPRRRPIAA